MDAIKFKQTTRNSVKAVTTTFNEWRKPLARQLNKDGDVSCVTIRVRILNGDSESDFNARFPPGPLLAKSVCKAIQNKQGLSEDEAKLFGLWMIGKDIELQVRPTLDLFELILFWHNWVTKYTHVPEAANPSHPVNNYWLVYRREALVSIAEEKQNAGQKAISLLYGEAKRNIMSGKYVCTQMAFATIAGIQQQILHGDYDQSKTPIGYLSDIERLQQLLPDKAANKMSASEWEKIITLQYKTFIGLDASEARKTLLEFCRSLPCYGCSFFPACTELPPSGYFEYRHQNYFIGVGPSGVVLVDIDGQKYIHQVNWGELTWRTAHDQIILVVCKKEKVKEHRVITPQAQIVANLCKYTKYKWAKENGKLRVKEIIPLKKKSSLNMLKDVAKGMSRSIANMGYTKSIQNLKKSQEQLSPAEKEAVYKKSTIVLKASASNLDKIMETYKNNSSQQDIQPQSKANSLYSSMSRISKSSEMKVANIDDSVESVNKEIAPIEHQVINVSENSKDRNSELKIPEIENSLLTNVQNNRIGKPVSPFMQRNTTLITNNRKTLSPFATPEPETNSNRESVIVIDQPSNSESDTYATRKTSKRPISRLNIPSNNLETNDTDPKPLSAMNMLTVVAPLPLSTSHSAEDVWGQAKRVSEPRSSFQRQIKQADSVAESLLSQLEQVVEKVRKGEVIDEANEDAGNVNDAPDEALLEAKDEVTQLKEEKQEELNVPDLQFQKHSILISKATTRNSHLNDKLKIADAAAEALLADFQLPSSQPGSNQNSPRFQNKTIRQSHATGSRINSVRHSTFSTTNDTSLQQEPQGSPKTGQFPSSRINTVRQSGIATAIAPVDTEKQELKGSPETRNISIRQSKMVVPIGTSNLKQKEEVQESPKLTHFGTRINSVREIKSDSTEANDLSSEHPPLKDSQLEHQMPSASDQTVDNTSARIASIKIKPNPFKRNTMSTESPSHSPYSSNDRTKSAKNIITPIDEVSAGLNEELLTVTTETMPEFNNQKISDTTEQTRQIEPIEVTRNESKHNMIENTEEQLATSSVDVPVSKPIHETLSKSPNLETTLPVIDTDKKDRIFKKNRPASLQNLLSELEALNKKRSNINQLESKDRERSPSSKIEGQELGMMKERFKGSRISISNEIEQKMKDVQVASPKPKKSTLSLNDSTDMIPKPQPEDGQIRPILE